YEARRFGVRSAMPSTTAMRKCLELVFVPPRFDVYRAVSRQIHAVFKDYTSVVEPLSLDEAYLDVTDNMRGIATAWETAKEIRARIYQETDLTASAGISCNKFLAKLASDRRKPNGQFAIMPDEAEAFVASLPVSKFHGVGPKTAAKMHALGIEAGVIAMADEVWGWCEKANSRGRTVTVKVKWAKFQITTRSRSLEAAIETSTRLREVALDLIRSVFPPPRG